MFRSDLIPHKDFHKGYWYGSSISNWYYFKESERDYNLKEFFNYEAVDQPIRSLVGDLHSRGINTTPSCSGHNYTESYFSDLYDKIKLEEVIINTEGLDLVNIETFQQIVFYDKDYEFKYSKQEFIDKIIPYHKVGILGIQENFSYIKSNDNYTVFYQDGITFFQVHDNHENSWKTLQRQLLSIWDS